jgi:hypothetical protein
MDDVRKEKRQYFKYRNGGVMDSSRSMATDDEVDRVEKKNESDNFQTRWRI